MQRSIVVLPEPDEPMIAITAQNMRNKVMSDTANLRSSGLFDGFLSK